MNILHKILIIGWLVCCVCSCKMADPQAELFKLLDNKEIGLEFSNDLISTPDFNVYKYRNFYNGGGVAIGDINNDGLVDVYMVSNQSANKLFLNKGDLKFLDITDSAAVKGNKSWSTGVTFADINNDGFIDIYVCNSGDIKGDNKENELFINNGNLTFTESAYEYQLNDQGFSTHAAFFDFDKDGDLDVYLLNNSYQAIGSFNLRKSERGNRDELGGDKLMENRNGKFFDISERAGIYGSVIGFGLGVTISDFNNDHWEDIFVSNDFFERDYLYINNQDGTFEESLVDQMNSISAASMGADVADIDNDGNNDLFVTDMLPTEYSRLKSVTTFESWNKYQYNVKNGYHHQFNRNMLHLNNGNNSFSEISRLAGVEASDWSWGALFFDMDNDGLKDLFVANGIYKDLTDQDYLQYISNEAVMKSIITDEGVNYKKLIDIIPSNPIENMAYKNLDGKQFEKIEKCGLFTASFSNGSAYGDLDNDGDLDLIVNNVNMPCFVYENTLNTDKSNYIKLELEGVKSNRFGLGTKIVVDAVGNLIHYDNISARGFQSSVDSRPNIGVGDVESVNVKVIWPSGLVSILQNQKVNKTLSVTEGVNSKNVPIDKKDNVPIFSKEHQVLDYFKNENNYVDFNSERLIYHMRSNEGGKIAKGDVNGDGLLDLVFPGAKGFETEIHLNKGGSFEKMATNIELTKLRESEHIRCELFDADQDGDLDMYLASGGVELSKYSEYLYDHLFINDGSANFKLSAQKLPTKGNKISTAAVAYADVDSDGDMDLFVAERVKIGDYGAKGNGYFLINNGSGIFNDNTKNICKSCDQMGMITDTDFADIDQDGDPDLIVVGEFMEILILDNRDGIFAVKKYQTDIATKGWWNDLELVDLDQDGDLDIVAGNLGANSRFKASEEYPLKLWYADFDNNGNSDAVLTFRGANGKDYPFALRHNLIDQIKSLKRKFPNFKSFKDADIQDIFTEQELTTAKVSEATQMNSVVLINEGNFKFESKSLPIEAQFSPVYASATADFDRDGDLDIILGGNQFSVLPEVGIYDGSFGQFMQQSDDGKFTYLKPDYGLNLKGEIRDFVVLDSLLIVQLSQDSIVTLRY